MESIGGSLVLKVINQKNTIVLGKLIIVDSFVSPLELNAALIMAKKSLYFGPLYLPLVVLPHITNRYWRNRFK